MISEEEDTHRDIAVSLTYDSSPESTPLVPRKSSTPAASASVARHLSPFSPEKKVGSWMTLEIQHLFTSHTHTRHRFHRRWTV